MARIVVVGGGVMGSSAAWHLARRSHRVTLLEQFDPGHDRGSSHGSSRIFRLAYADPFYVDLAARALPWWRRLEDETGTAILTLTGAVDHGPEEATRAVADALATAGHAVETVRADEAAVRWPGLRIDTRAVFHPEAGRLHADRAVDALQRAAATRGAEIRHRTPAERITVRSDGRVEVITGSATLIADQVVVAVGGWAPRILPALVRGLPALRVTQEQPAHFAAADPLSWPSFVHHGGTGLPPGHGVYGLGSDDGVKVGFHAAGRPVDDPSGRDRSVDPAAERQLREYAERWLPGVDAGVPASLTCLYTLTPDHDFVIDRQGSMTVLAGFSGHGFKFGSLIGDLAADLVEGRPSPDRFRLGRPVPDPGHHSLVRQ